MPLFRSRSGIQTRHLWVTPNIPNLSRVKSSVRAMVVREICQCSQEFGLAPMKRGDSTAELYRTRHSPWHQLG
ncbi:hypothetical protein NXS19_006704 [Fusarium pseudograminearum]|nr:hypothetical protein NXS19_006704 [Fusarium pseudograminearum]